MFFFFSVILLCLFVELSCALQVLVSIRFCRCLTHSQIFTIGMFVLCAVRMRVWVSYNVKQLTRALLRYTANIYEDLKRMLALNVYIHDFIHSGSLCLLLTTIIKTQHKYIADHILYISVHTDRGYYSFANAKASGLYHIQINMNTLRFTSKMVLAHTHTNELE